MSLHHVSLQGQLVPPIKETENMMLTLISVKEKTFVVWEESRIRSLPLRATRPLINCYRKNIMRRLSVKQ